jgi:hypothetical protein
MPARPVAPVARNFRVHHHHSSGLILWPAGYGSVVRSCRCRRIINASNYHITPREMPLGAREQQSAPCDGFPRAIDAAFCVSTVGRAGIGLILSDHIIEQLHFRTIIWRHPNVARKTGCMGNRACKVWSSKGTLTFRLAYVRVNATLDLIWFQNIVAAWCPKTRKCPYRALGRGGAHQTRETYLRSW